MRHLLQQQYIPFGSQYYRAPSPDPADWEKDLQNMAGLGFNTVKFWVQWRWNHPAEDEFRFDDIDRLMELAHAAGLVVMLNTIFDVAPAWIYRRYPDASMVTLDGRRIGPQTQPHRQIGGLGYCFNHEGVISHFFRFLEETVRRYSGHPALAIWNVGSEPELTSSMAEMRLFADDADRMGDMLCYCPRCEARFKEWLSEKYGTIAQLNQTWNRNYHDFAEVELPITRNTFNDMMDWRTFFVDVIGANVRQRFEIARAIDQGRHPLMCHHVFVQGFPIVSTANDPWNVGQYGDLHGFTQMDDAMMIDLLRSCARDKPVISAEMLMLPGYTLDLPRPVDTHDVKRFIFSGVAGNLKGFVFWQYRPEILGREAPAWGLTWLDGSETPWLKAYADCGRVLQKNSGFLLDARPPAAEVALLYHPQNQIFGWAATGDEKNVTDSLLGAHRALYEHNYVIDFIHPREFTAELLDHYRVLYIPFPYVLGAGVCEVLQEWVKQGGTLIGEANMAAWNLEKGRHETTVPGYGLATLFGARQGVVAPVRPGSQVELIVARDLPFIKAGEKACGRIIRESYFLEGAEVLAHYADGAPAITMAACGRGRAILVGSYIGLARHRSGHLASGDLIASLVEMACPITRPQVSPAARVRVDSLQDPGGRTMLIIQNLESEAVQAEITLPLPLTGPQIEQFTGSTLPIQRVDGRTTVAVALAGHEVQVYLG